jgi:IS1 family transposase/transposase-like protein
MIQCKKCKSTKTVKSGFVRQKQRYQCKDCGYNFVEGDDRTSPAIIAMKAMVVIFYSLAKGSYTMLGKIFNVSPSLICRWIKEAGTNLPPVKISGDITEIEFDEMWHFLKKKKKKLWIIKALDRRTRRIIAWELGGRNAATFKRLYKKLKHLKDCKFFTDIVKTKWFPRNLFFTTETQRTRRTA